MIVMFTCTTKIGKKLSYMLRLIKEPLYIDLNGGWASGQFSKTVPPTPDWGYFFLCFY